jgi:cell division protein FtsB
MLRKAFWLFGIATFLLVLFLPGYTKLQDLRERNKELSSNINKLKKENVVLQNEITRLENDPLYQEKIVRDKMGVVRRGEVAVKVVPETE